MSKHCPAIGIDLGTTYSVIGMWKNGDVKILQNEIGESTTPSIVSFLDNELSGELAKGELIRNPSNTVYNIKRLIGRKITDKTIQSDIKNFPFKVVNYEEDRIQIEVTYKNITKRFFPEEISGKILKRMKEIGELNLNTEESKNKIEIKDVVITVPAYFNENQTKATQDSAKIAGLNPLRIIHEPTAAAIAYGLKKDFEEEEEEIVLVFDLGGGTFDVSILSIEKDCFEVLGTNGDSHLGGEDFDNLIVDFCSQKFKESENINLNNKKYNKQIMRLKTHCEKAKRVLSNSEEAHIFIDNFIGDIDFEITITRGDFEDICKEKFEKCIEIVKECLENKKIKKETINEILLVGGSSRIPKIKEMLTTFFNGKKLNDSINPDEVVAYGATVQAAILTNKYDERLEDLILMDVNSLSLGTDLAFGKNDIIIEKYTHLPVKKTKRYATIYDDQSEMDIGVYEGEDILYKNNHKIGGFRLKDLPKGKARTVKVDVTFEIDENCILYVTAKEVSNGIPKTIKIINNDGNLTEKEIENILRLNTEESALTDYERSEIYGSEHPEKQINILKDIKDLKNEILNSSNELDRLNSSRKLETSLEAILRPYQNKDLENQFVFEKFEENLKSLIKCYGTSLSNEIYVNYDYIENIKYNLGKYLSLVNNHTQIIPLEFIKDLECNNEVYSHCLYKIINYHCNKIENLIKSKKKLIECKTILESDIQKLKLKKLNFDPEFREKIDILLNQLKILFKIKEGDELYLKASNNNNNEDLLFCSMDTYRICINLTQEQNDCEFEAICLAKLAQSYRKTNIYPTNKLLEICNRVEEINNTLLFGIHLNNEDWYQENIKLKNELIEEQNKISDSEFGQKYKNEHPEIFEELNNTFKKSRKEFFELITTKYPYKNFDKNEFKKALRKKKVGEKYLNNKYKLDKLPENNLKEKEYKVIVREIISLCNNLNDSPDDIIDEDDNMNTDIEDGF